MKWKKYIGQCGNFDFVMQSIDIIFCLKVTLFEIFNAQFRLLFILSLSRNSICVHGKRKKKNEKEKGETFSPVRKGST